jgi:hypothetical protein
MMRKMRAERAVAILGALLLADCAAIDPPQATKTPDEIRQMPLEERCHYEAQIIAFIEASSSTSEEDKRWIMKNYPFMLADVGCITYEQAVQMRQFLQ